MTEFAETKAGDRIGFDAYGTTGPGVVFIAGAGPYRAIDPTTTETARLLGDAGCRAIVFDRLGRGDSAAEGELALERELAAVAAAIEAAGGEAMLVGHSSGCAIALAAADAGLGVMRLALWEAPIGQFSTGAAAFEADFLRVLETGDLEAAWREYMRVIPSEILNFMESEPGWSTAVQQIGSHRADARALAWAEELTLPARLASVTAPTLVMIGAETFPGMRESAEALTAALPRAELREMPGAMHDWAPGPMAETLAAHAMGDGTLPSDN